MTSLIATQTMLDKEAIRELALLYCRAVDRKDMELLLSLYTDDGVDEHGDIYSGSAAGFVEMLRQAGPFIRIGCHYVCNHLISVNGDEAEGEVYAIGIHHMDDGKGAVSEDFVGVRYLDRYRRENGLWRFSRRNVMFDIQHQRPLSLADAGTASGTDASYRDLTSRLFARGARQ